MRGPMEEMLRELPWFSKKHIDAWTPTKYDLHPGRLVCAYSRIPVLGVNAWYCVYLKDGLGLAGEILRC